MSKERKNIFKIAIVGEAGVGKSSIVERIVRDRFIGDASSTIGAAYSQYKVKDNTYQIWDTAGQERYHSLLPMYLRDSRVVLVVYDVGSKHSIERIKEHWYDFVLNNVDEDCMVLLIGNKWDIIRYNHLNTAEKIAGEFARENDLVHLMVSAKDCTNMKTIFKEIEKYVEHHKIQQRKQNYDDAECSEEKSGLVLIDWDNLLNKDRKKNSAIASSSCGCTLQ